MLQAFRSWNSEPDTRSAWTRRMVKDRDSDLVPRVLFARLDHRAARKSLLKSSSVEAVLNKLLSLNWSWPINRPNSTAQQKYSSLVKGPLTKVDKRQLGGILKLLQNPPKYVTHTKKLTTRKATRRNFCNDKLKKLGAGGGGSGKTSGLSDALSDV